jgi:Tol biopolymer transport system component
VAPLALVATSCLVASAVCAAVPGEAIAAFQRYAGQYAVMSPDGRNFTFVTCGGDLTHTGIPRHFINFVVGTNPLPSWYFGSGGPYMNTELAASDEDCLRTAVLTNDGNKQFGTSRWSPDGSMVAAYAVEFDLASGALLNRGIFIIDVIYEGGRPVAGTNLRFAIPTGADRNFAWSPDSRRIVYVEAGDNGADLFMYHLDGGYSFNVTNTPGVAEDQPTFSVDERIAYTRQSSEPRGSYRYDIFSIPATGGPETQITSKATTGSFANMFPCYSPDGRQISFSSGSLQGERALYRIRFDGSGKAVKIVGSKGQDWRLNFWRR